ncbi:MAG TPA: hypothetical protein VJT32_10355 [bacterium]|nr:hypothetical protein [bacterium]
MKGKVHGSARGAAQLKLPMTIREAYLLGLNHALAGHEKMVSLSAEAQAAYDVGFKKGAETHLGGARSKEGDR